jgi:hypothetical protein
MLLMLVKRSYYIMRKQLDMEKLIEEVLGFQGDERKINIDATAMEFLDAKQYQIDIIRKHLRGDLARKFAESKLQEVQKDINQLEAELKVENYWWLQNDF